MRKLTFTFAAALVAGPLLTVLALGVPPAAAAPTIAASCIPVFPGVVQIMTSAAGAQQQPGRKHEPAPSPYRTDIQGHCRAANGQIVSANLRPPLTYHQAANGECYASNGRNVPVYFCKH